MIGNKFRTRELEGFKGVVSDIVKDEIKRSGFPTYRAAIVQKVNEDGTVDVYLPPDKENLVTRVLNKCSEKLSVGDSVEITTKNGSLTNAWVAIKHETNVEGQAEEVERLNSEVVVKVKDGRIVTSTLERDPALGSAFTVISDDINLDGMNIVLNGKRGITIQSPFFNVTKEGRITATSGKIGGWELGESRLWSGSGSNFVALDSGTDGENYSIWAGAEKSSDAPFGVTRAGVIKAASGTIGSFNLNTNSIYSGSGNTMAGVGVYGQRQAFWAGSSSDGSAPFHVGHNGSLYASSATITGNITATSGRIADYTIDGAQLKGNNVGLSGTSGQGWAFWAGSNDSGSAPFRVGHDGSLNATNAYITGTVAASTVTGSTISGGTVSGSTISGGSISIGNSSYYLRMGNWTRNPEVSGLNVGWAGIKAYSGIVATSFGITDAEAGVPTFSIQVPRQAGGGWYYMTWKGGILISAELRN